MNTVTHTPRIFGKQLSTIETVLELATLNIPDSRSLWDLPAARSLLKASTESVCTEHVPSAAPWSQTCFGGHGHARVPAPARPVHPIESNTLEQAADYRSKRGEKSLGRSLGSSGLSISEPRMGAAFCGQQARSLQVQRVGKTELGEWTAEVGAVARP